MSQPRSTAEILANREHPPGPGTSTLYREPVHLVRGEGVWVWDAQGRCYLDCYRSKRALDTELMPLFKLIRVLTTIGWIIKRPHEPWRLARAAPDCHSSAMDGIFHCSELTPLRGLCRLTATPLH